MAQFKSIFLMMFSMFFFGCDQEKFYSWSDVDLESIIKQNSEKMVLLDFETDW